MDCCNYDHYYYKSYPRANKNRNEILRSASAFSEIKRTQSATHAITTATTTTCCTYNVLMSSSLCPTQQCISYLHEARSPSHFLIMSPYLHGTLLVVHTGTYIPLQPPITSAVPKDWKNLPAHSHLHLPVHTVLYSAVASSSTVSAY